MGTIEGIIQFQRIDPRVDNFRLSVFVMACKADPQQVFDMIQPEKASSKTRTFGKHDMPKLISACFCGVWLMTFQRAGSWTSNPVSLYMLTSVILCLVWT